MRGIYLDGNATTPPDPEVVAAVARSLAECWGNPSSRHEAGQAAAAALQAARRAVRDLLGAGSETEVVFTSGGTESDNTAILAGLAACPERRALVVPATEHPAVLALCEALERERGVEVRRVGVDGAGRLDRDAWRAALGADVVLACAMWANNETGVLHPIAELAAEAHAAGALFLCDAVQAVGRVAVDAPASGADFLSLSAHKFHGPKGVGALWVRPGLRVPGLVRGGRQERGRRAGTENVPGIVGLGVAAALATSRLEADGSRIGALRERLESGILAHVPGAHVLGEGAPRLPNTALVAFDDLEGDDLVTLLGRRGVCVSSGSACSSGSMEPSHVLRAMRVPPIRLRGAVRFSLTRLTTVEEIEIALETLAAAAASLREGTVAVA